MSFRFLTLLVINYGKHFTKHCGEISFPCLFFLHVETLETIVEKKTMITIMKLLTSATSQTAFFKLDSGKCLGDRDGKSEEKEVSETGKRLLMEKLQKGALSFLPSPYIKNPSQADVSSDMWTYFENCVCKGCRK